MNDLQQLLEGVEVEWKTLGEVVEIIRGVRITKNDLLTDGKFPVVSGGIGFMGYTNNYNRESDTITIAQYGTAGYVKWQTEKFWANDVCFCVKPNKAIILNRYLYFYLINKQQYIYDISNRTATPYSIERDKILKLEISIPPLAIQTEIVRLLDTFEELSEDLTKELQKRREQYQHYSNMLFDNAKKSGVHSIEEVCFIEKGNTPIQKAIPGEYPMVVTTTDRKSCDTYQFDSKAVCIPLVSSRGHGVASLNHVYYQEGKFALGNILCAIIPKNEEQIYTKYLYYYFEQTKNYTLVPLMKGGANVALQMKDIKKVKVPLPPIAEQERIVAILDKFDTLSTSKSEGLPKEIELRKKQYEYYRDMLLSFPK